MEWFAGSRFAITPKPAPYRDVAFDVAMLGHSPGRARVERLLTLSRTLDEMRNAGYTNAVEALLTGKGLDGKSITTQQRQLYHLPIPLYSSAEFHDIFPDADLLECEYSSVLAGDNAWLSQSVDDFFNNGGEKLWLVRIPESEGQDGFLCPTELALHDVDSLRGIATVFAIPSVALISMPDLERLQIPSQLPDMPKPILTSTSPEFIPCNTGSIANLMPEPDSTNHADMPPPMPFESLLRMLLNSISRYRPDLQCLLTLPLEYSNGIGAPTISQRALTLIENLRNNANRHLLRHVQFLFPYLRGLRHRLYSPSGTIAGKQALIVRTKGPWHSVSGQPLQTESHPYPSLTLSQIVALRDNPGIGILRQQSDTFGNSQICLDDERLAVPALPLSDYVLSEDQSKFNGYRAAEIMRFLGYLRRQLKSFGEQLVFSVDTNDHRPRILLERFFRQLYNKGALRGAIPEEAYQIEQTSPNETTVQYDVQISPAFPIDKIIITFINVNGEWQGTVGNG